MHRLVLHNDEIFDAAEARLCLGQVGFMTGWGVFSTLRVSRGVPFAFERHFERMRRDAAVLRVPFPEDAFWLEERLVRLIEANDATEAVLRVNVVRNRGGLFEGPDLGRDFDVVAFTADLNKWGDSVRLGTVPNARHARSKFAGTKVTSWLFNLNLYEEAHERGFDEVILLNELGEVSECTSANIFAVFGAECKTPPLSSGCLPGVTREILLSEVRIPGLRLVEETLTMEDVSRADAVFITSTTRDVLPVAAIEGLEIRADRRRTEPLARALRAYREEYVCSRAAAAGLHD
jgi:branched-chain amino acid aminotransferase